MKIFFKLPSILLFGIVLSACSNDILDLTPSDGLPDDKAITNYAEAKTALIGVYDALQGNADDKTINTSAYYYGARMIYYGDVRGDDMQATRLTGRTGLTYSMTYNPNNSPEIWRTPYRVIRRANKLLKALKDGKVQDANEVDLNDMIGQSLSIRAIAHFDLARVYSEPYTKVGGTAMGIPIILEPVTYDYTASRNTLEEVYTQVISDLTEAIKVLKTDKNLGYFNQWAAKALLSRVYLYKGDYANAYNIATDVINNSGYRLWTTDEYAAAWAKQGTSEVIFEIVNFDSSDWVSRESLPYLYSEDGYADAIMTKSYLDLVKSQYAGDVRQNLMIAPSDTTKDWGKNKVYINKYPGREGMNDIRINNIPILRISEVYLIASEAALKLGDMPNATTYLNAIVLRGNPSATPLTPTETTEERILQEKRVEFVGEGHRFFDLMRTGKTVIRYKDESDRAWHLPLTAESKIFDNNYFKAILPIPESEISANSLIEHQQNPGY